MSHIYTTTTCAQCAEHCTDHRWSSLPVFLELNSARRIMKFRKIITAVFLLLVWCANGHAKDICEAVSLRDVRAIQNPDAIIKKGTILDSISQYNVDKKTTLAEVCRHGDYCYPVNVIEGGKKIDVLRLTNCKVGTPRSVDDTKTFYKLDVIQSKVSAEVLQSAEFERKLGALGFSNSFAGNAAYMLEKNPKSLCVQLAKKSVAGDKVSLNELRNHTEYCEGTDKERSYVANSSSNSAQDPTVLSRPADIVENATNCAANSMMIRTIAQENGDAKVAEISKTIAETWFLTALSYGKAAGLDHAYVKEQLLRHGRGIDQLRRDQGRDQFLITVTKNAEFCKQLTRNNPELKENIDYSFKNGTAR